MVWSRVPIINYKALPDEVRPHVHEDGLWGFTGAPDPAPPFLPLSQCMDVLIDLGITPDKIRSVDRGSYGPAGIEVRKFVCQQWSEDVWETVWFVNPHVSVSHSHAHSLADGYCNCRGYKVFQIYRIYTSLLDVRSYKGNPRNVTRNIGTFGFHPVAVI